MLDWDLAIANDHAGIFLKEKIIEFLRLKGRQILNIGADDHVRVDYPDFGRKMIEEIIARNVSRGILICGTGVGMSIVANRSSEIRAALCVNEYMAKSARLHNNANVLVLGSKIIDDALSLRIVDIFFNTNFEGGRHARRLAKFS